MRRKTPPYPILSIGARAAVGRRPGRIPQTEFAVERRTFSSSSRIHRPQNATSSPYVSGSSARNPASVSWNAPAASRGDISRAASSSIDTQTHCAGSPVSNSSPSPSTYPYFSNPRSTASRTSSRDGAAGRYVPFSGSSNTDIPSPSHRSLRRPCGAGEPFVRGPAPSRDGPFPARRCAASHRRIRALFASRRTSLRRVLSPQRPLRGPIRKRRVRARPTG